MRLSGRKLLVALVVVGAAVSVSVEDAEATGTPRYYLATRAVDSDGFLAQVRSSAPNGGIVAVSRDEDVMSAGWSYCVGHAEAVPGGPTTITVGGRHLSDGDEIRVFVRAALSSLCP